MRRVLVVLCLTFIPMVMSAQSADQEILSVSDSPDPATPGQNVTFTIMVRNNGPDPAVNGGINAAFPVLTYVSASGPAGFSCTPFGSVASCTNPSFPAGSTATITLVLQVPPHLVSFPDGMTTTTFSTSGVTTDPNSANNNASETTSYDTPQIDIELTASDSPDPVFPNGTITYTVPVTNNGPDGATAAQFSMFNNGTLRFQSASAPAGWNCTLPAVGNNPTFSCTKPTMASAESGTFTIVVLADPVILGVSDSTVSVVFGANATGNDTNPANSTVTVSTAYTTPDANLAITASDSPDPVANGGLVTFDITAENLGPDTANATVTFAPHPSLTFQSLTAPGGWSCTTPAVDSAGVTECTMSMANGASGNFQLVTKVVAAGAGGVLNSTFTISSGVQDPNLANNSSPVTTTWIGQTSDLAISKSTLETAVAQGGTITYMISTTNNGPDDASNVSVQDVLHAALLFQSIAAPAGWSCTTPVVGANGTVTCTAATLANGATADFTLVTTVNPASIGSITNSVTVGGSGTDPNPGNGSGSSGSVAIAGDADLGVTKTTGATSAAPGQPISYTITVTNNGPDPAASVSMTDTLPAGLLFQSISAPGGWSCTTPAVGTNGTVTCTAATLANGASAVFTLNTTVAPGATGTIANSANASHSGTDGNPGNSGGTSGGVVVVPASADLEITKTTAASSAPSGSTFSYTLTVTNHGPDGATNVVVVDDLPAGLQLVTATPSQGSCSGTDPVTCNLGSLINGASATITLQVLVTATSGTITNTATVSATEDDPNGGNDGSTSAPIPVTPAVAPAEAIPTLSEWMLLALAMMLAVVATRKVLAG